MKLEKVNDHQIRCTLTKSDLADRHMKLNELAYGTEKAKKLFRDMLQQASYEFGFDADNIPLMIEAIPLSGECIVLIITKVEDPEELDTRFSKFAPSLEDSNETIEEEEASSSLSVSADDVIDLFKKLHAGLAETAEKLADSSSSSIKENEVSLSTVDDMARLYEFDSLDDVIRAAHVLNGFYNGTNSLYKCEDLNGYYLMVYKNSHSPEDYNKVCNILSEYSHAISYSLGHNAFLAEHGDAIIRDCALQKLASI